MNGTKVSLTVPGYACRVGEYRMLLTDIYAFNVRAVPPPKPDELTTRVAKVGDRSGLWRPQRRTDVTSENQTLGLVFAVATVL